MKHKGLVIVGGIVLLVLVAALALPLFVNADAFRPTVESKLSTALGRKVEIGKLSLTVFSGSVQADQITISDDPRFSRDPFLTAKSLKVGVEMMPLIMSRTLKVTDITLDSPQVTLLHTRAGKWNFSSIGQTENAPKQPQSDQGGAPLSIGKLKIADGQITVAPSPSTGKKYVYDKVNVTASDISADTAMPFTLDANTPGGGSVKLDGTAGPLDKSDAALSPVQAKIDVKHMDLSSTGFLDPDSGVAGVLDYTGNVKSEHKSAHLEGNAKVSKLRVVRTGTPAPQPVSVDYASDYNLATQSGMLTKGTIQTGSSTARLTGNYDAKGDSTILHMKLAGSALPLHDIESLLPAIGVTLPAGSSIQGGTVDANLGLDGAVDKLVTSGTLNVANAKLAGFGLASKLSALSALTGLKPSTETLIQQLSSNLRIAPEGIRADNLNLQVPDIGSLTGNGVISANNALDFHMMAKLANGGGVVGQLAQLNPLRNSSSGGAIPFMIQGTTSKPVFLPDVKGALGQALTGGSQQGQGEQTGLGGILGGLLGGKKKPQQ